jgi:spore coat polysaccharide biosynthesis protein SpsF (cytidylyltransferase family)
LARYHLAAKSVGVEAILRVTSDCPLIDPDNCAAVLRLVSDGNADFAANNMPPSWPHGLDCEAFSFNLLERAHKQAQCAHEREHVGPYMRRLSDIRKLNYPAPPESNLSRHRWTVDTPSDFEFVRHLIPKLPMGPGGWSCQAVMSVLKADPALAKLSLHGADVDTNR